jgi:hypothetical protein
MILRPLKEIFREFEAFDKCDAFLKIKRFFEDISREMEVICGFFKDFKAF